MILGVYSSLMSVHCPQHSDTLCFGWWAVLRLLDMQHPGVFRNRQDPSRCFKRDRLDAVLYGPCTCSLWQELHETEIAGKVDLHVSPGLAYQGNGRHYPEGCRLHCAPPELP